MLLKLLVPAVALFSTGISAAAASTTSAQRATTSSPASPASILQGLGVNTTKYPPIVGNATQTCKILNFLFPNNETFVASSPLYTPLYEEPWSQTCWLEPACIMTPDNATQLSTIVKIVTVLQTKFAVRSGGHKSTPGFNGISGNGILLALENLRNLAISSDRQTLTTGTGNRWENVYNFVQSCNVTAVGGRIPIVGVAGFTLGGGVNLFVNEWGLALDRVARFQVVLMDGSIVDATPTGTYADLFKALKGGMSNFGIVTEFDLLTVPNTEFFYEGNVYTQDQTPALLGAYGQYLADPKTDPKTTVNILINSYSTAAFLGKVGPSTEPPDFAGIKAVQDNATALPPTNGTLAPVFATVSAATKTLGSWVGTTFSHKVPNGDLMQYTYSLIRNASASLPPTMYLNYVPQGILPNMISVGSSLNGGNLLGLESTPQIWVDLYMTITDTSQAPQAASIVSSISSAVQARAQSQGLLLPYVFPNSASADQKPLDGFGAQNLAYIKSVAKKYDPLGFMQSLQNDGYLIRDE